jgi:drug/metabolite transporter (DMT)-like permease
MTAITARWGQTGLAAPYLAAAVSVLIWGATPVATKIAVGHFDPLVAAVVRTMLAAIIVLPILLSGNFPLPTSCKDWALLFTAGICGFAGFTILFSFGVQKTSASHAALINASIPVFTGIFGAIAERRVPGRLWFIGVGLALIGETVLIFSRNGDSGGVTIEGDLLCVLSSVCSGLCYVAGARLSSRMGAMSVTFWGVFIAAILQLPILWWFFGNVDWGGIATDGWTALLFLSLISTVLAFVCWYWALARGGAVRMGTVQFAMPIVSLSLAVWIFQDTLTPALLAATTIIIAGIAVARRG